MKVISTKNFDKDILKIRDKKLASAVDKIIGDMYNCENITQLSNRKKIKSAGSYYRIRYSDYRLGFKVADNTIILLRFLHRKDIYRYFPDNY